MHHAWISGGDVADAYNNNLQILQTHGYVVLVTEMIHDVRIVPVDGRVAALQGRDRPYAV